MPLETICIIRIPRTCSIEFNSISAITVEPIKLNFEFTMILVVAFILESLFHFNFTFWGQASIKSTIVLQVIPLVVFAKKVSRSIFACLIISLLETELTKFSHGSIVTTQFECFLILCCIDIGASIV